MTARDLERVSLSRVEEARGWLGRSQREREPRMDAARAQLRRAIEARRALAERPERAA